MKLKYFIPSLLAVIAAVFTGCSDDKDPTYLDGLRVSQSYVSLDINGGSTSIDVTANGSWAVTGAPDWLTVSPASGTGNGSITFSAGAGEGRTAEVKLTSEGQTQLINIIQGIVTVQNATCAEVMNGPDSKTYRVSGTVTKIANTTYGNWYLDDGTYQFVKGSGNENGVYIYGTLDSKGATKNFASWGLEEGDQITVEGPKTTYNGTIELVDVTVVKIVKSLIKVDSLSVAEIPVEGGDVTAYLTCKGTGVAVEIPAEAQDWLGVATSTIGANPTVTFHVAKNDGGVRETTVTFKTTDGTKEYMSTAVIKQAGAIVVVSVAEFLAAPVGPALFKITGVVADLYPSDKQGESFYIQDFSGKTLVYRAAGFKASGAKVGDIVTVVGQRGAYKDSPQMVSGTFENIVHAVTPITIEEFLSKPDNNNVYYMVTGTISSLKGSNGKDNDYGNLYITDGTNELYVYGCYPGWGATGDARKFFIAENGIQVGDELTMIGYKDTYNGLVELCGGTCFSFKHAE